MKKIFGLLIATIMPCLAFGDEVEQADYKLNVAPFRQLTVVDGVNVDFFCSNDSVGWVVFNCEPEKASQITFNNNKEHLTIQTMADGKPLVGLPRVKVYSSTLMSVENSGDSLLRVYMNVPVPEFKAKQIGNGRLEVHGVQADSFDGLVAAGKGSMTVDGTAKKAKFRNVSTGNIEATSLDVPEISCFIFGPGHLHCAPTKSIKIMGAGSGKVYYPVKPEKVTNRSIGVKSVEGSPEN